MNDTNRQTFGHQSNEELARLQMEANLEGQARLSGQGQQAHEPCGILASVRIENDGFPVFMVIHSRLERRADAKAYALKYMQDEFHHCLIFVRRDGCHETWSRGQLEAAGSW